MIVLPNSTLNRSYFNSYMKQLNNSVTFRLKWGVRSLCKFSMETRRLPYRGCLYYLMLCIVYELEWICSNSFYPTHSIWMFVRQAILSYQLYYAHLYEYWFFHFRSNSNHDFLMKCIYLLFFFEQFALALLHTLSLLISPIESSCI